MGRVWVVETPQQDDFTELCQVWEGSVRATHDFLPDRYIQELRELVAHAYLKAVKLICCKDPLTGRIVGFCGIHADKVEMLFIDPEYRGRGVGKTLLRHAIDNLHAVQLDVNAQNPQAIGFYFKQGFEVIGRSETDGMGEPYPLLHLRYKRTTPAQGKCSRT